MRTPIMKPKVYLAVLFLTCSVCSAATNVMVEETSARIQYTGSRWSKNEQQALYHGGAHDQTQEDGGKAVFTFTGTAIYYYASLWPFDVSTVLTLDNEASQTLNLTDPDQPNAGGGPPTAVSDIRWQRTDLPNGLHTLTVERGTFVLVDAFAYTTDDTKDVTGYDNSASGSLQNVTVQESDPQITYTGDWTKSDPDSLYSGGNHAVSQDVAASAVFNFTGVAVYYHASLWQFQVTTVLTFDDGPEEVLDLYDHSVPNSGGAPTVESVVRWSRANLADGQHSLKITTGSHALVDAITYTKILADSSTTFSNIEESGSPTTASSNTEAGSPTMASSNTEAGSPTTASPNTEAGSPTTASPNTEAGSPTATETPSSGSSHSATIGGAVGGTLGGLLILAALAVILFRRSRRNRRILELPSAHPTPRDMSSGRPGREGIDPRWAVEPFVVVLDGSGTATASTTTGYGYQGKGGQDGTVSASAPANRESSRWEPPPPSYHA
ncbi:hypothetical protein D9758_012947 [Tetrapyrgos nigripes]|uniref:Transmembrane protein n=1 Tax=Tetrapyrgos nigripes TaxID=182062 RepID=A0A8H5CKS5_9AGAR|nr:hypothetical protein D9758_012947 [Tetrapyrgos nigripes]